MSEEHTRRRTRSQTVLILIGVLAVAILGFAAFLVYRATSLAQAVHARNEPMTIAELDVWYKAVPDAENAALLVLAAGQTFVDAPAGAPVPYMGKYELAGHGRPLSDEVRAATKQLLDANQQCLKNIAGAASLPNSRYPGSLAAAITTGPMAHLATLRSLARLAAVNAIYQADAGAPYAAGQSVEQVLALGDTLKTEPVLISQLVRCAVQSIAFDACDYVLSRGAVPDDALASLQARFVASEDPKAFYCGLVGERCFTLSGGAAGGAPGFRSPLFALFMTSTAHSITDIAEATTQPEPQRRQRLDALQADLTAMSNGSKIWSLMNPAIVIVPALLRSVESQNRANAQLRVAATAVAVERYRIAHGTLPETLEALTPDLLPKVPLDPFDNQGLRYLRLDTGFTVYSVGVNAIDEKGAAPSSKDRRGGDIAIHVLR